MWRAELSQFAACPRARCSPSRHTAPQALLSKKMPEHLDHVKSMRDFAPATLHPNPHAAKGEGLKSGADSASLEVPA